MQNEKLNELKAAQAKVEQLKQAIIDELASLPARYGFNSVEEFIKAVKAAIDSGAGKKSAKKAAGKPGRKPGKKAAKAAAPASEPKSRKRGKITPELKEQVKLLVSEGKTTQAIASALKISAPSVQNVKKELGLVKARAAKAPAAVEAAPAAVEAPAS
jgi:DNA-binding NarL/FixJ family response regulator